MTRWFVCALMVTLVLILAACGGSRSSGSPSALTPEWEQEADAGPAMPTVPLPPIVRVQPPPDPLALPAADAVSELPEEGIALFAQDEYNRIVRELPLELAGEPAPDGTAVSLRAREDSELPPNLLLYLRFDPQRMNPRRAEFAERLFPPRTHLRFSLLNQRGYVPLAVAALPGAEPVRVARSEVIARVEFAAQPQPAEKRTAKAPGGAANEVEPVLTLQGLRVRLGFEERNAGDYNLDGTVSIADVTQIAMHFSKELDDLVQVEVIDGSGNGKVDISDVTTIAMNFGTVLSGYDVELAFAPEGETPGAFERIANANPELPTLPRPPVSLPQGWPIYSYILPDRGYGTYRVQVVPVGAGLSDRGAASPYQQIAVENLPPPPPLSFYVTATDRTSVTLGWSMNPEPDVIGHNVYVTQDEAANELADFTQVNPELLAPETVQLQVTGLTPTTDYWFVIEAVDSELQGTPENDVLATKVHASTVVTPTAVITVDDGEHYELYEIAFSGAGSSSPDGAELVSFTWDWGDGSPAEEVPPPGEATHTYQSPNVSGYLVRLTVEDEYGAEGVAQQVVPVLALRRDVLVVYNLNSADDLVIADYYASPETGRAIHPSCVLGLGLPTTETISWDDYNAQVREPIKDYLDTNGIKNNIYYIVTCREVPLKIPGTNGGDFNLTTYASVDSELCIMYETYDREGRYWNPYYGWNSSDETDKGNPVLSQPWQPFHFTQDNLTMDYLVTRLTGYTKEDALAVVDRCRNAYAGTDYVIVLDDVPGRTLDWMHDPVGNGNDSESASSVLIRWGFEAKMFDDDTDLHVIGQDLGLNKSKVLLYCSHGTHSHGIFDDPEFILNVLDMGFLPGALFNTYESYNGWSFRGVHNSGQELLQDFISVGGTGGSCNVYEPWNVGCMDESITFAEYLHCGRNLAEACYKGIRFVSWMNCVVGDPLTAVIVN